MNMVVTLAAPSVLGCTHSSFGSYTCQPFADSSWCSYVMSFSMSTLCSSAPHSVISRGNQLGPTLSACHFLSFAPQRKIINTEFTLTDKGKEEAVYCFYWQRPTYLKTRSDKLGLGVLLELVKEKVDLILRVLESSTSWEQPEHHLVVCLHNPPGLRQNLWLSAEHTSLDDLWAPEDSPASVSHLTWACLCSTTCAFNF